MIVTKKAPNFLAPAVLPDGKIVDNFELYKNSGKNGIVLFFWPKDFTFVCPSEIIAFDNKCLEFRERGYNIIGVSIDSDYVHLAWRNTEVNKGGIGHIKFPIVSDIKKEISIAYDVLCDAGVSLRASFLIDRQGIVRHAVINDLPLGRNIDEMLRMVDALTFFEQHGDVCPANWKKGQDGMKATPEGVSEYLSKNKEKL
ncbi:peroxiredoxin [Malacoplasma muris]|uniref:peroxiredoxin n=1 Tax=Malacoplasma muris TaxID=2119 RepID=UPI00398E31D4